MKIYETHCYNDFVVCLGYKDQMIKEYFLNYYLYNSDVTIELAKIQLNQVTPTIQIVDKLDLPLYKTKKRILLFALGGFIAFSLLSIFYFTIKKVIGE